MHVQYQKVNFFFKSTARKNFPAMGLESDCMYMCLLYVSTYKSVWLYAGISVLAIEYFVYPQVPYSFACS